MPNNVRINNVVRANKARPIDEVSNHARFGNFTTLHPLMATLVARSLSLNYFKGFFSFSLSYLKPIGIFKIRGLGVFEQTSSSFPVSYTHLRAHETDSYLVCRLLLEKKKTK